MANASVLEESRRPRVLLVSQRSVFPGAPFRCPHYEFEDIICQIDSVDVLTPVPNKWFRYGNRIAQRLAKDNLICLNPGIRKIKLQVDYDLLFAVIGYPKDLLNFNAIMNWKDRCKVSICLLDEFWVNQLSKEEVFLRALSKFDCVMLYYGQTVKALNEAIGGKCFYLPPGIDAIKFCPYPESPKRFIDVCSIGRRSELTHQAFLGMAKENGIYYVYDTLRAHEMIDAKQHRFSVASMLKRSEYYLVYPGLIDKPEVRGSQLEIGNRFFEGAAAGAIMIGEAPSNGEFERLFDWPDALIHLPYNSVDVRQLISDFNKQPERKEQIRKDGVVQSLLRHDWVYRWECVLNAAGLNPTQRLLMRKQHLTDLAAEVKLGDLSRAMTNLISCGVVK